jgi:hypothetical protein
MNSGASDFSSPIILPVDREHMGIRFGLVGFYAVFWVITFVIVSTLIPSEGPNIIAVLIAFVAAAVGIRLIDPILKERWPSGRTVEVDAKGVRIRKRGAVESEVQSDQTANILLWRFKIPRRGRMPKGWSVVACAVEQNNVYLPIYAFASPEQMERINQIARFVELVKSSNSQAGNSSESLRVAGEQRRLRLAEEHRWNDGAEMTVEDFTAFVTQMTSRYPLWLT